MFSPNSIRRSFFPGENWIYFKLYMGPETAEDWICHHLTKIIADLENNIPEAKFFFVRFLDPDFHIRLRIWIPVKRHFGEVVEWVNQHSVFHLRQKLIWKLEMGTYEREIERYGSERIELFENAFHIDSVFWLSVLSRIENHKERENLRWKIALISSYRYYRDIFEDQGESIRILSKISQALKQEQNLGKTILFQIDQKFRHLRTDLMPLMEEGLPSFPELESLLHSRSSKLIELFDPIRLDGSARLGSNTDQNFADLVHMSLNRALRSKHRMQEFVIYHYLMKLMKTQRILE